MATAKSNTTRQKKRTATKQKPRFYAVQSIEKSRDNWMETIRDYNDKYVMKPFESGKDFMGDMRKDPRKVMDDLFSDGKKFTEDVKKDPRKVLNDLMDDGKDFAAGVRKDIRKAVENAVDGSRDFYRAMGKDSRKWMDGLSDSRKKMVERIPGLAAMENGISRRLQTVPDWLNLPSKKDVDKLNKSVKTLNTRLNTLTRQYSL